MNTIKIGEVSKILGLSHQTIRKWEKSGILVPTEKINGHRYYDKTKVEKLKTVSTKLSPKEVSEKLGVSVKTLQMWDNIGKLVAHRTPTNRRFYTEDQLTNFE